jgi:two-component system LytT family response regulator
MDNILNTIICDDEGLARKLIVGMLAGIAEIKIVGEYSDAADALKAIEAGGIDLVFMDVEMPKMSGVDAASRIQIDPKPLIIFTTAHPEYAVDAFGIDAIDYVMKPFNRARLRKAITKAMRLNRLIQDQSVITGTEDGPSETRAVDNRINLQDGAMSHFFEISEIVWIEAAGDYSVIHKTGGEVVLRRTLSSLIETLPQTHFARVHRSSIVALGHIQHIQRRAKGEAELTLDNGTQIRASRSYRDTISQIQNGL